MQETALRASPLPVGSPTESVCKRIRHRIQFGGHRQNRTLSGKWQKSELVLAHDICPKEQKSRSDAVDHVYWFVDIQEPFSVSPLNVTQNCGRFRLCLVLHLIPT